MKHAFFLLAALCLGTGCPKNTEPQPAAPAPSQNTPTQNTPTPADGALGQVRGSMSAAQETCVDKWLKAHQLDRYGNPEGTMYTGGSPLFNESTGETLERLPYVFARQPDAKTECPGDAK